MAEKDFTEKTLEAYNDVFADIVNGFLFGGRDVVQEEELEDESARSIYKADGKLHEQERDVAKYWRNSSVRIALYGLENQTAADADMPLRMISYDGAAYRSQLLKDKENEIRQRYPVVTLVLYFGLKRWDKALTLYDRLEVPEELKPFVNDYRINLFEVAWLSEEQVELFKSDFKIVADYFVQMRKNREYHPSAETITHVHEVLELMSVLTDDHRFELVAEEAEEGGLRTMCEVLDRVEARGEARGEERGKEIGKELTWLQSIKNLMETMKWTAEQAMEKLMIPEGERAKYAGMLKGK